MTNTYENAILVVVLYNSILGGKRNDIRPYLVFCGYRCDISGAVESCFRDDEKHRQRFLVDNVRYVPHCVFLLIATGIMGGGIFRDSGNLCACGRGFLAFTQIFSSISYSA